MYEKIKDEDYLHKTLHYCLKAYKSYPDFRFTNCLLTYLYCQDENWGKCIKHAKEWIVLSKKPLTAIETSAMSSFISHWLSNYNSIVFVNYFLALAYTETGDLKKAEICLEDLINKNTFENDELINYFLANYLYILKLLLGKIEDVNKLFKKCLKKSKRDFPLFISGINYLINDKYDYAVSMLKSISNPDEWDKALLKLAQYKNGNLDINLLQNAFDSLTTSEKANENFGKIILNKISFELDLAKNIDFLGNEYFFNIDYKICHQKTNDRYTQPFKSFYNIVGTLESLLCDLWQIDYILHVKNAAAIGMVEFGIGVLNNLELKFPKLSIIKEKKKKILNLM